MRLRKDLIRITAAASIYLVDGKETIWIYLVNGEMSFKNRDMPQLWSRRVGVYKCKKILEGLSRKSFQQLSQRILRLYKQWGDS